MNNTYLYADIIIPGALDETFTYATGKLSGRNLIPGSRVIIPFGARRLVIGIIEKLHNSKPDFRGVKEIVGIPSLVPFVSVLQLDFWNWISEYYMCARGEVMDAALPSGLKLTKTSAPGKPDQQRYRPRLKAYVGLGFEFDEGRLGSLLDQFETRSPARYRLLTCLLDNKSAGLDKFFFMPKDELIKISGVSGNTLNSLVKRKVLKIEYMEEDRIVSNEGETSEPHSLSPAQSKAKELISEFFKEKGTVLLKGVTSSGKTEIYIHLIKEQLDAGKQVLYLLPEIALTKQIINRLRRFFGRQIGIYHSGLNDNEKVEVWRKVSNDNTGNSYNIILGVRSSVFLPFYNLGLVIIDEEHDASYKQKNPAPRYNARDSAVVLAGMHGAKVLMGSATPSIESVYNSLSGKYGLVELNSRFGNVKMPEIEIADTKEAYRRKIMISHFTPQLIAATEKALRRGEQVVFFKNRRGYAPVIVCNECGWTPVCDDCSVNMTYHKGINTLKCHYCGKSNINSGKCGNCGSGNLQMKGYGTEKIEDEISLLFPEARVERMDLDTTRKKYSIDKIISRLEEGKTDILVGTQMISKGLDFEDLTLVGILNIDNMLFFPDFRAGERCFQMIGQVSGRAGRRERQGKVVLQSIDPNNSIILQAINHDYWAMYKNQLEERKEFLYPPFTRLVILYLRHQDRQILNSASQMLAKTLRTYLDDSVLGPEYPVISKVQKYFYMTILIKVSRKRGDIGRVKLMIKKAMDNVTVVHKKSRLRIYADVDPV